jgi:hypothetical protein
MANLPPPRELLILADFATIFAHMWYRDFPLHPSRRAHAQRADWTTHIGLAVRSSADLLGLFTHFESGGRTDAILRDNQCQPVAALEWEWDPISRGDDIVTEYNKLRSLCSQNEYQGLLRFACLICYAREGHGRGGIDYSARSESHLASYTERWTGGLPPLLLVLIHYHRQGSREPREFTTMTLDRIEAGKRQRMREQFAYPWLVNGSRWEREEAACPGSEAT